MRELFHQPYSTEYLESRFIDLFFPENNANGKCILFVHGGGWTGGSTESWHSVARFFADQGYFCASADYRRAPEFTFPAPVEDLRLAVAFLRRKAPEYGYDPDLIAAIGSSAGGHLVAMLGTIGPQGRIGQTSELDNLNTRPAACICYCPITYVQLWEDHDPSIPELIRNFMGNEYDDAPNIYKQASPSDRIMGDEPPFLFIHGDMDALIPVDHSKVMHSRLRGKGRASELLILRGAGHGFGYGVETGFQKTALAKVSEFLDTFLSK